jgi:hypothetical protein
VWPDPAGGSTLLRELTTRSSATFPLVLRSGVSIYGAGANLVTIRGSGSFDHGPAGGIKDGMYEVTLVVGDGAATTTVSGVTVLSAPPAPITPHFGVFCDRGSAPATGTVTGVTSLDSVVLGPSFQHAILVGTSTIPAPSGCNLRMTRSTVTDSLFGILAVGCLPGQSGVLVSLQVGDMINGNSFTRIGSTISNNGAALIAQGCVTNSSIRNNLFADSTTAISIDQAQDPGVGIHPFAIEQNIFANLWGSGGLWIVGNAPSVELYDNTFRNIAGANAGLTTTAFGLVVAGSGGYLPLKKARRNSFIGNDIAVYAGSAESVAFGPGGPFDFGTPDDPGGNIFRCNSMVGNVGSDIWFQLAGTGEVPLAGNIWDHLPPAACMQGSNSNGTDVVFAVTHPPMLQTSGGQADSTACPANRVPGPAANSDPDAGGCWATRP